MQVKSHDWHLFIVLQHLGKNIKNNPIKWPNRLNPAFFLSVQIYNLVPDSKCLFFKKIYGFKCILVCLSFIRSNLSFIILSIIFLSDVLSNHSHDQGSEPVQGTKTKTRNKRNFDRNQNQNQKRNQIL